MRTLSDALMWPLKELLAVQIGLSFPKERWGDLERGMIAVAKEFGMADVSTCVRWLLSASLTHQQLEILASNLTVGETYFFRDQQSFHALEQHVLPDLIQAKGNSDRNIRIWSAGCCTGEEPYSIAMLLSRLVPDYRQWNPMILGTDINPRFLRKATTGIYGEWSFRNVPAWVKEGYFKRLPSGLYEIHPRIKQMVTFSYLNLAEDTYPSLSNNTNAMDIILCRNVLMYFTLENTKKVVNKLGQTLVKDGWLLVSPVETSRSLFGEFTHVNFPGATFYRKCAAKDLPDGIWKYQRHQESTGLAEMGRGMPEMLQWQPPEPRQHPLPRSTKVKAPSVNEIERPHHPQELDADNEPGLMARSCANQGKLADARLWCEKMIAKDKLNPDGYYLLASIQQEMGDLDLAEASLKRVLYLDPDSITAHFALGNFRLSQGDYAEAARFFRNASSLLKAHPYDETLAQLDGLTAGRLAEIVNSLMTSLPQASGLET